jgi:DNA repair protein RadC
VEYRVGIKDLPAEVRPRERLLSNGSERLSDWELLAIILRTGSQHANALELAQGLLARYKGLEGLSRASVNELCEHPGVGPAKAAELKASFEVGRRLSQFSPVELPQVRSPVDLANLLSGRMAGLEQEHLQVALLNTRNRVLDIAEICTGSLNVAAVRVADIFREAVRQNAAALILVHNHPSGDPTPSAEDVRLTAEVRSAGELLDLEVLDHLVIGRGAFVSLRERGLGFEAAPARRSRV